MPKSAKYPTNTKKSTGLSSTRMTSRQSGSMKRSHGITNGGGKHKQLFNASGAIGANVETANRRFEHPSQCIEGKKSHLYRK